MKEDIPTSFSVQLFDKDGKPFVKPKDLEILIKNADGEPVPSKVIESDAEIQVEWTPQSIGEFHIDVHVDKHKAIAHPVKVNVLPSVDEKKTIVTGTAI